MTLRPGARVLVLDADRLQVRTPHGAALEFTLPGRARAVAIDLDRGVVDAALQSRLDEEGLLAPPGESTGFLEDGGPRLLEPRDGDVLVTGPDALARPALDALRDLGAPARVVPEATSPREGELLLVLRAAWARPSLDVLNERCVEAGAPFLVAGILEPRRLHLGPLVVPGETACLRCYLDRRVANTLNREGTRRLLEEPHPPSTFPGAAHVVATFAALEAARFQKGLAPATLGTAVSLGLDGFDVAHDRVLKAPRCPACSRLRRTSAPEPWTLLPKEAPASPTRS